LGVGTQLALSVAAGLSAFCGLPASAPQELARSVGRGRRSAIGTYGFVYGGLIVEQGKLPSEGISPLDTRLALPEAWRFVLVRPIAAAGLSGDLENAAIEDTVVDPGVTSELIREVREELVPAVATGAFSPFASSLDRYCKLAGSFYLQQQGGLYNGPILTSLVDRIRSWGHEGVGQSSWGPTLFVVQPDQDAAQRLEKQLRRDGEEMMLDVVIARPDNRGACIEVANR
jgi:beta-RFAP synthase